MFTIESTIERSTLEAGFVDALKRVLKQLNTACEYTRKARNHEPFSIEDLYSAKEVEPLVRKQWEDLESYFTSFKTSLEELSSYVTNEVVEVHKTLKGDVKWMQDSRSKLVKNPDLSSKIISPRLFADYIKRMDSLCKSVTRREYVGIPPRLADLNCSVVDGNIQRLPSYYNLEKTETNHFLASPYNWTYETLNNTTVNFCNLLSSIENMNRVMGEYARNTTQSALQAIYIAKGKPVAEKNLKLQPMIGEAAQQLGLLYNASIVEQYYADNLSLQLYNTYLNIKSYSLTN